MQEEDDGRSVEENGAREKEALGGSSRQSSRLTRMTRTLPGATSTTKTSSTGVSDP